MRLERDRDRGHQPRRPRFLERDEHEIHAALALLRREAPISWHQHPDSGRQGFWAIVRADDITRMTQAPDDFSSRHGPRVHVDAAGASTQPGAATMRTLD